jgi:hypothetical protein
MTHEFVPPEPPAKTNLANAWVHIPPWGRIVLYVVVAVAAILASFFIF